MTFFSHPRVNTLVQIGALSAGLVACGIGVLAIAPDRWVIANIFFGGGALFALLFALGLAWHFIEPFRRMDLVEIHWATRSLQLPLEQRADGAWIPRATGIGPKNIGLLHRGDKLTVTRVTMMATVRFYVGDRGGYQNPSSIVVFPAPPMRSEGAHQYDYQWNTANPELWALDGLPTVLSDNEELRLPVFFLVISDAGDIAQRFASGQRCTLHVTLGLRTDAGNPRLPDLEIPVAVNDLTPRRE